MILIVIINWHFEELIVLGETWHQLRYFELQLHASLLAINIQNYFLGSLIRLLYCWQWHHLSDVILHKIINFKIWRLSQIDQVPYVDFITLATASTVDSQQPLTIFHQAVTEVKLLIAATDPTQAINNVSAAEYLTQECEVVFEYVEGVGDGASRGAHWLRGSW